MRLDNQLFMQSVTRREHPQKSRNNPAKFKITDTKTGENLKPWTYEDEPEAVVCAYVAGAVRFVASLSWTLGVLALQLSGDLLKVCVRGIVEASRKRRDVVQQPRTGSPGPSVFVSNEVRTDGAGEVHVRTEVFVDQNPWI